MLTALPLLYMHRQPPTTHTQLKPTSIEKETFPAMAGERQLHSMDLPGFWMDVGQPKDYLSGTCLYLSYLSSQKSKLITDPSQNPWVHGGNVLVDPTAQIDPSAVIGPNVVIGPRCVIGKGVRLQRCAILEGARVKDHAWIHSSIVGWNSTVGRWVRLENISVLGDDGESTDRGRSAMPGRCAIVRMVVLWRMCGRWGSADFESYLSLLFFPGLFSLENTPFPPRSVCSWIASYSPHTVAIKDELLVNGASVLPHKSISNSILTPSIVM